jgi:hypothetical protein
MIQVVHPGSGIPNPDPDFLPIPDPEVKKTPDPGSAATLAVCLCEGGESTYLISMDMPWDSMVYLISAMMVRLAASIPRVQAT